MKKLRENLLLVLAYFVIIITATGLFLLNLSDGTKCKIKVLAGGMVVIFMFYVGADYYIDYVDWR